MALGSATYTRGGSRPLRLGSVPLEGAVPRTNLWSHSMPRVELDQRSREASLRLEQIERLFRPPVRVKDSRLLRLVYLLSLGTCSAMPQ
jgi:hypothetical protein